MKLLVSKIKDPVISQIKKRVTTKGITEGSFDYFSSFYFILLYLLCKPKVIQVGTPTSQSVKIPAWQLIILQLYLACFLYKILAKIEHYQGIPNFVQFAIR